MFERALILAVAAAALSPGAAAAQDWRSVTSFRQRASEEALEVRVRYGAGRLLIRPSEASGDLYRVGLRYDSDLFDPITEYRSGELEVGVEGTGRSIRLKNHDAGELDLRLSRDVPLDLDLDFGAVEADLELGGLRIRSVDIETGASDSEVRFSSPNPVVCERIGLSVGAASFLMEGIANANCRSLRVEGGVGDITLDLTGDWRGDMEADIDMALGSITLFVPADVGVRVDRDTFLLGFEASGFEKRDGVHVSSNWNTARHRLTINLNGAFGSFNVVWRN